MHPLPGDGRPGLCLGSRQTTHKMTNQNQKSCPHCGAPFESTTTLGNQKCSYCGKGLLDSVVETQNLVKPRLICPFEVQKTEALQIALAWLGKSGLGRKDARHPVQQIDLQPVYYPFWSVSGEIKVRWRCKTFDENEETTWDWQAHQGEENLLIENVLVSGSDEMESKRLARIEPFDFHAAEAFFPSKLKDESVLAFTRPAGMASAIARSKVSRSDNPEFRQRILPGRTKRDLWVQAQDWIKEEHLPVLLPVWVGSYSYDGKPYRFYINGQNRKISGIKPRLPLNLWPVWIFFGVLILVLIFIALLMLLGSG